MSEYVIISAATIEELQRDVNNAIKDFKSTPIGGPFVSKNESGDFLGGQSFNQAMLRPKGATVRRSRESENARA